MKVNSAKAFVTVSAGIALLAATAGCGMLEKPTARITGVKLQDVQTTSATMLFDVQVDNPYTLDMPLSDVDYALTSQGQRFVAGEAEIAGAVPAGGSKTVGIPVRISYVELINAVKGAAPGVTIPYTADLGLSMDAPMLGRLRVPVSREGELTIPSTTGLLDRLRDLAN